MVLILERVFQMNRCRGSSNTIQTIGCIRCLPLGIEHVDYRGKFSQRYVDRYNKGTSFKLYARILSQRDILLLIDLVIINKGPFPKCVNFCIRDRHGNVGPMRIAESKSGGEFGL